MAAQIEQLYRTTIRAAIETAPGSGIAVDDDWWILPVTGAAVERVTVTAATRKNVFTQATRRDVVSQSWSLRTSHEATLDFLLWILVPHFDDPSPGIYRLAPEDDGPTFVVETVSEAGDIAQYTGCRVGEIQIALEDRRILQVEIGWIGLRRIELDPETIGARPTSEFTPGMLPTWETGLAITNTTWGATPRVDNAAIMHGGQIVLTRPIESANFGPDGIPGTHTRAAWEVMAEIFLPETPGVTDLAFADQWTGKLAIWLGTGNDHFRLDSARGFVEDEDLAAYDWRVRRLVVQAESDDNRALLEFRA